MKDLKPILLALGAKLHAELPGGLDWTEIELQRMGMCSWVDSECKPTTLGCGALIHEEIRLALREEGFTDFCTRQRNDTVYAECFDWCSTEGTQRASANSELEAWLQLYTKYKNIREDGE